MTSAILIQPMVGKGLLVRATNLSSKGVAQTLLGAHHTSAGQLRRGEARPATLNSSAHSLEYTVA